MMLNLESLKLESFFFITTTPQRQLGEIKKVALLIMNNKLTLVTDMCCKLFNNLHRDSYIYHLLSVGITKVC